ncbi:MAG: thermonuclease family protein [Proteobacteria bacterium]|nr:thermonuclease family protein [Pseudomonadota bacterium]
MTLLDIGTVTKILAPDTILLDHGKRYRLGNIRVPADYSQSVIDVLGNKLLNTQAYIYSVHKDTSLADRYGIPLVYIVRKDGLWIQQELISKGLAWAFNTESSPELISLLKQIETQARIKRRGFWSNPTYAVKTPDNVQNYTNSFQIVQGKILNVTAKQDYTYVNFGYDWRQDFTVSIKNNTRQLFNTDPQTWVNKTVRIRGWVKDKNGPMIELTHPEQMEFLK